MTVLTLSLDADQLDRQIGDLRVILRLPRLSPRSRADLTQLLMLLLILKRAVSEAG
ncbi:MULTISPECIES: hypothetical protein [Thalassobaculum]|uniref:Uncharacterized protein n=1 Tax=Thalassobaculum litoreum DSM 18839 TaxID=1123362 RepID=A0A8G2BIL6_9PROT|nr:MULTISPECIES: hypothetical protein [Thalassobaculum]SDF92856.1 hypothetical protein SAMN05660686_02759 [Thalassobaculum litoreum DSM 18839]